MPPDTDRGRRLGQPTASTTPRDTIAAGATNLADATDVDGVLELTDPRDAARHAGELLQAWVGAQMEEVDELVAEAKVKLAALPSQVVVWELFGELLVRLTALERDVADLRADRAPPTSSSLPTSRLVWLTR